jgi:hypothetical protein
MEGTSSIVRAQSLSSSVEFESNRIHPSILLSYYPTVLLSSNPSNLTRDLLTYCPIEQIEFISKYPSIPLSHYQNVKIFEYPSIHKSQYDSPPITSMIQPIHNYP